MPKLDFAQLLMTTIDKKASDLHLTVGNPPMLRIHGSIQPMDGKAVPLTQEDLHASLYDILAEEQRKRLERDKELDFALELKNVGRFVQTSSIQDVAKAPPSGTSPLRYNPWRS